MLLLRRGGEFLALSDDEAAQFGGGQGEVSAGAGREFGEGEGVGGVKFALPFRGREYIPAFGCDPMEASHVGCWDEAVEFEEFGVSGGASGVGQEWLQVAGWRSLFGGAMGWAGFVEVDDGEHLASHGLVADPEDEGGAPLHSLDHVGEGEEKGAEAFGIHGCEGTRYQVRVVRYEVRG